jgi:CPA2 family monovalent cation:H+ antiporter-2
VTDAGLPYLRETLLFLALAGILIPLLQRLRINQILGFLAVGTALGPNGLGLWTGQWPWLAWLTFPRPEGVAALAELGVLFLMFLIGLDLSAQRLWEMRRWVFGAGLAQIGLTAAVIGVIAWSFENTVSTSLVLGLVLSLSSTAVVIQLLSERRALASRTGQAVFSVLMMQDLAVVPILMLIDILAAPSHGAIGSMLALAGLKSVVAVGLVLVVGRRAVGPMFRGFTRQRQPEVFVALTLLTTLSIAGLTAAAGLSMALGAFLAGLLLAETEFRHEVEITIEPFKGLLMGLFFMAVGMRLDLREIAREPLWLALSVIGLVAIKGGLAAAAFRLCGLRRGQAVEAGLLLGQGGEFAFIVVGAALVSGLLDSRVGQFMLLVVSASLYITPAMSHFAVWLGGRIDAGQVASGTIPDGDIPNGMTGHVIVAGCGRVGKLLIDVFASQQVRFVAIEQDANLVARLRAEGIPAVYGNAARAELLARLHAGQAAAVVITMDQPALAMQAVRAIRQLYPELPVFARSRDEAHARELLDVGATLVTPETLESALQMAHAALQQVGVPEHQALLVIEAERSRRVGGHDRRPD